MSKWRVGIDPGKEGAVAVFKDDEVQSVYRMPLYRTPQGKDMVDGVGLYRLLFSIHYQNKLSLVVIEEQNPRPVDSKKSVMTLGRGYGAVETAVRLLLDAPYVQPSPQEWKKHVLKGCKNKDKAATIGFVQSRFPSCDLYMGQSDPHDGIADAVCIGYYGVLTTSGV